MERIQEILTTIDNWLWGNWLLFVLLAVGILYTVISGGVQVRHFKYIIKKTLIHPIRYGDKDTNSEGSVSSFQALNMAIASCVGSGNIVGVATAVLAGGLGAIFWMWVAAFVGMATKYGEIILGMLYRQKDDRGIWMGGPMYYIRDGLHAPWLAFLCSIFMVVQIIGGNFIQSNTIGGVVEDTFQIPPIYTGVILTVLIFVVSAGGLKRFAHVARKVVPFMATLYIASGLLIILINIKQLPGVFADIFAGAFGLRAVSGGVRPRPLLQRGWRRFRTRAALRRGCGAPCRAGNCRCNRGIPGYICHLHDHRFGAGRHRSDRSRDLRKRTAAVCF